MEKFIDFVVDLANEELYQYLDGDAKKYFLQGGCLEFATIIKAYIKQCEIVINKALNHCAIQYKGKMYDARGEIKDRSDFNRADDLDLLYMKERFGIPEKTYINGKRISDYLVNELKLCNVNQLIKEWFSQKEVER